jgi:hypothetical protein
MFAVASDSIRVPLLLVYLVVELAQDSCLNYCMSRNNIQIEWIKVTIVLDTFHKQS